MKRWTYEEAQRKAVALREIGESDVYLSEGPYPWHIADTFRAGGTHRLGMATSVWFEGTDPDTGLHYRWMFDVEGPGANGKPHFEVDAEACRETTAQLPDACRQSFREYLLSSAEKVRAKGDEYQRVAEQQKHIAYRLEAAAPKEVSDA